MPVSFRLPRNLTPSASLCVAALFFAALSSAQNKPVLGKLAQAMRDVGIHSKMSTGSHVYYHTQQYQYLVVNSTKSGKWVAVVLSNGMNGYVPTDAVAVLPYLVTGTLARSRSSARQFAMPSRSTLTSSSVANLALSYRGVPYKWGGTDLSSGIDCSAFVKKMFGAIGVDLPRTAAEQVHYGTPITRLEYLQAGDRLYFYSASRHMIGHTGIYLGNGYFVHSSSGKGGVSTSALTPAWLKILVAARR